MMSLLSMFTGNWKKSGTVAPDACRRQWFPSPPSLTRPPTALEERQRLLAHHVRLVARGMANGLCVYGSRGGLGKTRVVLETLKEEGVEPVILTGHCTPLAMYMSLVRTSRIGRLPRRLRRHVPQPAGPRHPAQRLVGRGEGESARELQLQPVESPVVVPLRRQDHLRRQHPADDRTTHSAPS